MLSFRLPRISRLIQIIAIIALIYLFVKTYKNPFFVMGFLTLLKVNPNEYYLVLSTTFFLLFFISLILFHLIFFRIIFSLNPSELSIAFIKAIDYVWYIAGTIFVIVIVNEIQISLFEKEIDSLDKEGNRWQAMAFDYFNKSEDICNKIDDINYTVHDLPQDSTEFEDIQWAKTFCDEVVYKNRRHLVDDVCRASRRNFYPSNDPVFWDIESRPKEVTEALNALGSLCTAVFEFGRNNEKIAEGRNIIRNIEIIPAREGRFSLYCMFSFVIGLRLTKTSFEVVQSMSKFFRNR